MSNRFNKHYGKQGSAPFGNRGSGAIRSDQDDDDTDYNDGDDRLSLDEVEETLEVDQLDDYTGRDPYDDNADVDSEYADSEYDGDADMEFKPDDMLTDQPDMDYFSEDKGVVIETIVPDDDRVTSDRLSRYEMVELLNIRATQISKNPICFVDVSGIKDPVEMALKELYQNKCPLLIKREVSPNVYEIWNPNAMVKQQL